MLVGIWNLFAVHLQKIHERRPGSVYSLVLLFFLLLTATLLVGALFGTQLYGAGTGLKWSHKTAFSVLSWLTFAVLLTGRARFGWRGKRAVRVLYIGASLLLLAYVGSRFVMEIVLGRSA